MNTWHIGEVVRKMREEQGIGLCELSRGLCSVSTLSRIEAGQRDMGVMLGTYIFERLGYSPEKYEIYGGKKDFELYEMREKIRNYIEQGKYSPAGELLEQYEATPGTAEDPLHRQFIRYGRGKILIENGCVEEGIFLLREAVRETIPMWKTETNQTELFQDMVVGIGELKLVEALAEGYERIRAEETAFGIWNGIYRYLEEKQVRKDQMSQLFAKIVCRISACLLKKEEGARAIALCDEALETLKKSTRLYHWPELLRLRAAALEVEFLRRGQRTREEVIAAYQKAYSISCLYEEKERADAIKRHLQESYQWESMRLELMFASFDGHGERGRE